MAGSDGSDFSDATEQPGLGAGGVPSGATPGASGPNQLTGSAAPNALSGAVPMSAEAAPPPPPPARRGFAWQGLAVRVGVIAVIVIGALFVRDRLSGAATDLRVGDCFDEPVEATEVSEVQHQPCTDAHDGEVFFVADYTGDSYPVISGFTDYVVDNCIPAFETYVGRSFEAAAELDMSYFFPTLDGWGKGDHEITCYLVSIDGAKLTTSMKAGG